MSRLSLFRLLYARGFVRQPMRAGLAIVAVAAGVAITVGAGVLITSIDGSIREVVRELAGPAPIRVLGPLSRAGLDGSVAGRIEKVEGVASVVPAIQAVTIAERANGEETPLLAIGVDCRIEALVGSFGCDAETLRGARSDAPVLISAALKQRLGAGGVIRTAAGRVSIDGVTANDTLDDTNRGRVAVFTLHSAQELFARTDRLDVVYVLPDANANAADVRARIARTIGAQHTVLLRDELPPSQGFAGPILPLLGLAAIFALGLSGLLVYNIVALTLAERRRDIAVASAVGVAPRSITSGAMAEAGMLGLAGGVLGSIGGLFLGRPLVSSASAIFTEQSEGILLQVHVAWSTVLTGIALGGVTGVVASIVPALRARKLDLAAELHGRGAADEATRPRIVLRLALLIAATGIAVLASVLARRGGGLQPWQATLGGVALLATAILVFAAAGTMAPLLLGYVLTTLRRTGGPVRVGIANLVSQPRRTTVTAAAVAAAVGFACVLGALIPAIRGVIDREADTFVDGRVLVSTLPLNNSSNVDARLSPSVIAELEALPGVASLDRTYYLGIGSGGGLTGEVGLFSDEARRAPHFEVIAGEAGPKVLERGDVVVGTSLARRENVRPGSILRVPTPTGFADLRVAGIWASTNNNGNSIEISPERLRQLFGPVPSGEVYLRPERGVPAEELKQRVLEADLDPDIYVRTPDEMVAQLSDEVASQAAPFWALQRMMLFVALVGTLSTLLLVGVQRRRELGILGAVGFGPGALGRMTLSEGIATALVGGLVGTAGSLVLFEALRNASAVSVGARPPFVFDPVAAVVGTALAVAVVVAGAALPAWRASRLQVVEAIRDE